MDYKGCLQQIQTYLEDNPLIILGSGASASYGLPLMSELKDEILKHSSEFDSDEFNDFYNNLNSMNLEEAMDKTAFSDESRKTVRKIVWSYINTRDGEFLNSLTSYRKDFAMADLFEKVIQPTPNSAVVVTTNYDRIAEYAADVIGATTITGFEGNFIRTLEFPSGKIQNRRIRTRERIVSIWKVHGSLDWFKDDSGKIVSYPLSASIPLGHVPLIIPPGKAKYSDTHGEPYRDIITQADTAFSKAGSYLCVGYGFNDEHIQPKLLEQIKGGKPIVVLSREATEACRNHIISTDVRKYAILERVSDGKTSVTGNGWKGEYDGEFWGLSEFIKTIWG